MALDITSFFRPEALTPTFLTQQKQIKEKATARAVDTGVATSDRELVRRDLLPEDVGFTNNDWAKSVDLTDPGEFEYIKKTLEDWEYIVIIGVAIHDTNVRAAYIAFDLGAAQRKAIIDLHKAYVQEEPIILFNTPIKYEPGQEMIIKLWGLTTGSGVTYRIQLLGYKIEPVGKKIGKPTTTS